MLDLRDEGMDVRGTFGNPSGNSVFFFFGAEPGGAGPGSLIALQ